MIPSPGNIPAPERQLQPGQAATWAAAVVHHAWFQRVIVGFILLAGVTVGLETNPSLMKSYGPWFKILDRLIAGVFTVEIGLKLLALAPAPWRFFRDGWNVLDFVIVAACLLPLDSQFAAAVRLIRILRVLRLVTAIPKLQLLVGALLKSLGSMGYVAILLLLMFYIYGVIGVHLFGKNDPLHFGALHSALLSLFQVITLENWSTVFQIQYYGSQTLGYEGQQHLIVASQARPVVATVYFLSFILLGTMIMLNLFIGIIMNSMSEMHTEIDRERQKSQAGAQFAPSVRRPIEQELQALEEQIASLRISASRLRSRLLAEEPVSPAPPAGHRDVSDQSAVANAQL